MQERLIKGTFAVHETYGAYRNVEELWDGEQWAAFDIEMMKTALLLPDANHRLLCFRVLRFRVKLLLMMKQKKKPKLK